MKIIIHGAAGRMGRMVEEKARENVVALVDPNPPAGGGEHCYAALADYTGPADVVVDFSHHAAVGTLLDYCVTRTLPSRRWWTPTRRPAAGRAATPR